MSQSIWLMSLESDQINAKYSGWTRLAIRYYAIPFLIFSLYDIETSFFKFCEWLINLLQTTFPSGYFPLNTNYTWNKFTPYGQQTNTDVVVRHSDMLIWSLFWSCNVLTALMNNSMLCSLKVSTAASGVWLVNCLKLAFPLLLVRSHICSKIADNLESSLCRITHSLQKQIYFWFILEIDLYLI